MTATATKTKAATEGKASTIAQARAIATARRMNAAQRYFELLRDSAAGRKGAGEELSEVAAVLGRSPDDFDSDAELVQQIILAEKAAARVPKLRRELDRASAARKEALTRIRAEREAAEARWAKEDAAVSKVYAAAHSAHQAADGEAATLARRKRAWAEVVGVDVDPPATPGGKLAVGLAIPPAHGGSRAEVLQAISEACMNGGCVALNGDGWLTWANSELLRFGYAAIDRHEVAGILQPARDRARNDLLGGIRGDLGGQ